jgi:hypothetical protein
MAYPLLSERACDAPLLAHGASHLTSKERVPMSRAKTFDFVVAARTRTAAEILRNPDLLAAVLRHGGRREDLEKIQMYGQHAEALHQERSGAKAVGKVATITVKSMFAALRREHRKVLAVVRAVLTDMHEAGAPAADVGPVEQILVDETAVRRRLVVGKDGTIQRQAVRSRTREAIRAEIQKDAGALLALTAIHPALAERKVDQARLTQLRDDAQALSGQLAEKVVRKADGVGATRSTRGAAAAQRRVWVSTFGILALAAEEDVRIRELLADTTRRR